MDHLDVFMLGVFMCAAKVFHTYGISYAVSLFYHPRPLPLFFYYLGIEFYNDFFKNLLKLISYSDIYNY